MDKEIHITERKAKTKGEAKELRREKQIPVCIYSKGNVADTASVGQVDFETVLREVESGFLSTTIFALKTANGKTRRAVIKDIQYKPTTYQVLHLDFQELHEDSPIDIKVPVKCLNALDCSGVKLGGYLRSLMRHVKVRCLPRNIPNHFEIDVKELNLNQNRRVSDLVIPKDVRPLVKSHEIVVAVMKK
ncbi:MAG: 50S ribosomal protein L25/general stress protein Ctc [Chlamydiales bacterium]|nr:50S ribosomal protein L25/general stress protein Ctc [Chlamydiales bacterium]